MSKVVTDNKFTDTLKKRFQKEMPRIREEIRVYESHLKSGKLNTSQKVAPQFNR